jgi:hypothetical protein
MGFGFQNQVHKGRLEGIPFDIELGSNPMFESIDILVPDMPGIGSWMYGDTVCPESLAIQSHRYRVRDIPAPAVAEQGDFVDVDAKPGQSEKLSPQAQDRAAFGLWK